MSNSEERVIMKQVDPIHVVSTRRSVESQGAIVREIAHLLPAVRAVLSGPPIGLRLGPPVNGALEIEVAFPVAAGVEVEGFEARTLPGMNAISLIHRGPLEGDQEGGFAQTWRRLVTFVQDRTLLIGDDPIRFVYHRGVDGDENGSGGGILEIQLAYHLPVWLERLEQGVRAVAGDDAANMVMRGSEDLAARLDGDVAATWVHGAIDRLDVLIPREVDRARVLNPCAHRYIVTSADLLRRLYAETGTLRSLVRRLNDEDLLAGDYWIDESGAIPRLFVRRRPAAGKAAYDAEADPIRKRSLACFCPLVRGAILREERVSRTFCHCSAGWYVQEWQVVFGQPPVVDVVESLLDGADRCVFAVQIPPGFL